MFGSDSGLPSPRRAFLTGLGIYLFCQIFFLIYIQFPVKVNFDEFHYVPAARDFIHGTASRNWEHPPLGKMLIAAGIRLGGDRPFGWRLASTTAGALTLVGIYFMGLALFRSNRLAQWVALLSLCNFFVYVQSRIALLDPFMVMFLVWGLAFLFRSLWQTQLNREARGLTLVAGCLFGLALACKWPAAPVLPISALFVVLHFRTGRSALWALAALIALPVATYVLALSPLLWMRGFPYHPSDLIRFHQNIVHGLTAKNDPHFYESHWYQWPLLMRSIWYAFDHDSGAHPPVRGVFLIGNPLLMWTGLVALIACAWAAVRERAQAPLRILCLFLGLWLFWILLPRRISFFYYYYPSALMLSFAVVYALDRFPSIRPGFGIFALGLVVRAFLPTQVPVGIELYFALAGVSFGCAILLHKWSKLDQQDGSCRKLLVEKLPPLWSPIFTLSVIALFIWFFPVLSAMRIESESFRKWMWFRNWI